MLVRLVAALASMLALVLLAPAAEARRFALLIGNNTGNASDQPLKYAESDAQRMSALMLQLAGFGMAESIVLTGRGVDEVWQAVDDLSRRMSAEPGEHLFFFYFSGHADARGLHLGPTTLVFSELERRLLEMPAAVRVAVVDACQSGTLTRAKGGAPIPAFEVTRADSSPTGLAILASTSENELAQESDELAASFFTHNFEAGLRGLADRNRDGEVTLVESFDYAAARTLDATLASAAGPQHPTYRYDLAGRREVVLSYPGARGARFGNLAFDRPGWYFVQRRDGRRVLELESGGSEVIALEVGEYDIKRRDSEGVDIAVVQIGAGNRAALSTLPTTRVAFGRAVRKGGEMSGPAFALSMGGLIRSSLASLGPAAGLLGAWRVDASAGSIELRAALARAVSSGAEPVATWDTSAALAALKVWDFSALTLGAGVEAGWAMFIQELEAAPSRFAHAAMLGPTAVLELPWGSRLCARLDLSVPVYALALEENGERGVAWRAGVRGGLAAGGYF